MNHKELVRVAGRIQDALGGMRKSRYLECARQLSLFTGSLHEMAHGSRKLALALVSSGSELRGYWASMRTASLN